MLHLERLDTDVAHTCTACAGATSSPGGTLTLQSLYKERSLCLDLLLDNMARVLDSAKLLQMTGQHLFSLQIAGLAETETEYCCRASFARFGEHLSSIAKFNEG